MMCIYFHEKKCSQDSIPKHCISFWNSVNIERNAVSRTIKPTFLSYEIKVYVTIYMQKVMRVKYCHVTFFWTTYFNLLLSVKIRFHLLCINISPYTVAKKIYSDLQFILFFLGWGPSHGWFKSHNEGALRSWNDDSC